MRAEGPARGMEKEILGAGEAAGSGAGWGSALMVVVVVMGGELLEESERELEAWRAARWEMDVGEGWARGCERRRA